MKGIMIQGTNSDSGKSFITTALCRVFSDMGLKISPFKSQNMTRNTFITEDGLEMGIAQAIQAEAARLKPSIFMSPILLKPRDVSPSEIILMGKSYEPPNGKSYADFALSTGLNAIRQCLKKIEDNFEMVVIEGAGSPAEINLSKHEIVNMRVAKEADVPVILVADINRGGAMAAIVGTLDLLGEDRNRVKGLIYNKFHGDVTLFQDAVRWTEEKTGIKVLGVIPWLEDVFLESEDSLSDKQEEKTVKELALSEKEKNYNLLAKHVTGNINVEYLLKEIIKI
ncbi:MAG: cobyric acid synthase [Synergistaceae bacterium]|jgi:adenosylcobyric acid synthase|nr:cobyric acid synthase [Synergistaceae bacterium]